MATATRSIADRLGSTIFLAVLAHGVIILGVTFSSGPFKAQNKPPALNVTLLADTGRSEAAPEHADYLANRNAAGGGELRVRERPTRAPGDDMPARRGDPAGTAPEDGAPLEPAASTDQLVTRARSERRIHAVPKAPPARTAVPVKAASSLDANSPRTLALETDVRTSAPSAADESKPASPSARRAAVAAYLVGWRERVERIGTANFPARYLASGHPHGKPTLEVVIGPDGHLENIVVRKSSGDTRLDQAALKILRLAEPFAPLPPSIRAKHENLRFAYEWDFDTGSDKFAAE